MTHWTNVFLFETRQKFQQELSVCHLRPAILAIVLFFAYQAYQDFSSEEEDTANRCRNCRQQRRRHRLCGPDAGASAGKL